MYTAADIKTITVVPTITDAHRTIKPYSHSMFTAMSACPTKGLVTYHANKVMRNYERSIPLEAGSACHAVYSAARIWQIMTTQELPEHAAFHGLRLFGETNWYNMLDVADSAEDDSTLARRRFCLQAFYDCNFYDDPNDNRRTYTNIEEALTEYLIRHNWQREIWVSDPNDPTAPIGVEITVDYIINMEMADGKQYTIRFVGTADGLTVSKRGIRLEENKTSIRLDEVWASAFQTSHQQTGYMLGVSTMYGIEVNSAAIHGMSIPLPVRYDGNAMQSVTVRRSDTQYMDFYCWLLHNQQMVELFGDNPLYAPKNTNACTDFYRACSLLPLCASDGTSREEYYDLMEDRKPTPTEEALPK